VILPAIAAAADTRDHDAIGPHVAELLLARAGAHCEHRHQHADRTGHADHYRERGPGTMRKASEINL